MPLAAISSRTRIIEYVQLGDQAIVCITPFSMITAGLPKCGRKDAEWYGINQYLTYDINDELAVD